mmetsp:Transcript_119722/g.211640  ORF Transcript_119722/g.211640 Transcript_119722/m.211640 type:complete len:505 (-) Transcript_119722:68-1582(-)
MGNVGILDPCKHAGSIEPGVEFLNEELAALEFPGEVDEDDDDDVFDAIRSEVRAGVPEVLTPKQVANQQETAISEAAELLDVPRGDAFLLLRHYKWNQDRLGEDFFADTSKVRETVGVHASDTSAAQDAGALCGICFTDPPISVMPCGHNSYCGDCWKQYVETAVQEGKGCLELKCPTAKCGERLRPEHLKRFCSDELWRRYERFLVEAFVEGNSELAWCPGRGCDRAARKRPGLKSLQVECPCGLQWCLGCKSDTHRPVPCEIVQEWSKKNKETSEDSIWLVRNTKPCPKCKNPIEKNGGCMHMTCRPPGGCGYEFCWICMQNWKGHTLCNKFADEEKDARSESDKNADLLRYVHYLERFREHERAQKYADSSQRESISSIANALAEAQGIPVKDVEFLTSSVDEIVACRRFLKWTYAFAYISVPSMANTRQQLFEYQQAQLEGTLEKLSDVTENARWGDCIAAEGDAKKFPELRGQVVSLLDVVRKYFETMSESLRTGDFAS